MIDNKVLDELMGQLKEGNENSFNEIYDLSKSVLYYTILSITKNTTLAEDVLQETYLKVLENKDSYKPNSNAISYLITIARNLAINAYNKNKKVINVDVYEYQNQFVSEDAAYEDESSMMKLMFETLNSKEIEIVTMHVIDDLTHQEIAKILKRPLGTITWQYNNAMKKLRKKAGDYYE